VTKDSHEEQRQRSSALPLSVHTQVRPGQQKIVVEALYAAFSEPQTAGAAMHVGFPVLPRHCPNSLV